MPESSTAVVMPPGDAAAVHSYTTAFVWAGWIFVAGAVICGLLLRPGAPTSAASSTSDAPVAVHM